MPNPQSHLEPGEEALGLYAGRWVACLGGRVVGQGGTPSQALLAAHSARFKEIPQVFYVPTTSPLAFSELLERVRAVLPSGLPVYLVGGAVRDALLSRPTHDLDFVLSGQVLQIARKVANALGGAYYPLDEERETARVVLIEPDGGRQILDFAALRGPDLESDLRARDFTINAMAIALNEEQALLDPLGGMTDLRTGQLRACAPTAFQDDPVRIVRAIRQAAAFSFHILPETRQQMRQAAPLLGNVSSERLRDELFRILSGPQPATALRALEMLGALTHILPELPLLKGVTQSPPHVAEDVWAHTLDVLRKLESVLAVLGPRHDQDAAANMMLGQVALRLGRYREQINSHLDTQITPDRSYRPLLFLAALYHDVAKPQTRQVDEGGRTRFFEHDLLGAKVVGRRASTLHLSNEEIQRLKNVVRYHMRPLLLAQPGQPPTRRAIYRFFRAAGPAGVDACILSMADVLATYGSTLPQDVWENHLNVVRALLEAWWEQPQESVAPPPLLDGHDLINGLGLQPGPQIGRLLEAIREAQATGEVQDRQAAFDLARKRLEEGFPPE